VVFEGYATGDHSQAKIVVFNQSPADVQGLRVRVRVYDLNGKVLDDRSANSVQVPFNGTTQVMALPRYPQSTPVFFVRCQLSDSAGSLVGENTYWQSQKDDDMGDRKNDSAFDLKQDSWADMTALNTMAPVRLELSAHQSTTESGTQVAIRLHNPSERIAFFERAAVSATENGGEILPIRYDDNYITVYPGETAEIHATLSKSAEPRWVRLEGYNTPASSAQIE